MAHHDLWTLDALIEAYKQHQRRARGLREQTLHGYERLARLFVHAALGDDALDPTHFRPHDVVAFVASLRGRYPPASMKFVRTALRSFFRFLRAEGLCDEPLEAATPAVAHWRLSSLPRYLSDEQLKQVLSSFDVATPLGHRNRAIVLCLSTLGLRPGEVARLRLEDIDWRGGTIELRARKNGRAAVLPLPREAGCAIVTYLREERPTTDERRVFVQHHGSRRGEPIPSTAVTGVAVRALRRGGVEAPFGGAYVFRHTVATRLVRRGASSKKSPTSWDTVASTPRRSTPSSICRHSARWLCPGRR